jgi:ATP-dependent DNA helicase RecG
METMEMMRQANLYCYDLETNKSGFNLAALMLFGKQEFIQSALPYYRLDAVVRLDNVDRYDDRLPLIGNIIDSYDALMAFVEKHLPDPFFLEGDQRTSLREKIFREIISNVLVHREYMNPTYTVFEINREGIIVSNANKPLKAGPVTLRNYVRHPKNPHMANFFMQMGRAEHLGTGIRNLYHYVPIYTGADPVIMDDDMYTVKMSLPKSMQMLKAVGEDTAQDTAQVTVQDTAQVSNQVKMLIVTLGEETLSRDELMARLHLEHRENFRLAYLKPAIDDEFVNLTIPDKPTSGKQKYFLSKKGLQKLRELRIE